MIRTSGINIGFSPIMASLVVPRNVRLTGISMSRTTEVKSNKVMVIWKLSTWRPCLSILTDWFFFQDHTSRGTMRMQNMLLT